MKFEKGCKCMNQENKTSLASIIVTVVIVLGIIFFLGSIFSGGSGSSSSSSSQRKALEKAMEKSVTGEEMSPREKSEYDSYKKWEQKQKWDSYDKQYK